MGGTNVAPVLATRTFPIGEDYKAPVYDSQYDGNHGFHHQVRHEHIKESREITHDRVSEHVGYQFAREIVQTHGENQRYYFSDKERHRPIDGPSFLWRCGGLVLRVCSGGLFILFLNI